MDFVQNILDSIPGGKITGIGLVAAIWALVQFKPWKRIPRLAGSASSPTLEEVRGKICTPEQLEAVLLLEKCWTDESS